jgi:hypothetical protein
MLWWLVGLWLASPALLPIVWLLGSLTRAPQENLRRPPTAWRSASCVISAFTRTDRDVGASDDTEYRARSGHVCVRRASGFQCRPHPGRSSSSSRDCRLPSTNVPNSCAASAPRQSQMVKPTASNVRTLRAPPTDKAAVTHEQPYHMSRVGSECPGAAQAARSC